MSERGRQIRASLMPADLNPYDGIFGDRFMSQMTLRAGSLASGTGQSAPGSQNMELSIVPLQGNRDG